MRAILYAIFDKETKQKVYINAKLCKVLTELEKLGNAGRYEIRHTWKSF